MERNKQVHVLDKLRGRIKSLFSSSSVSPHRPAVDKRQKPRSENRQQENQPLVASALLTHELRAPLADLLALVRLECQDRLPSTTYQMMLERIQGLLKTIDHLLSDGESLAKEKREWVDPDDLLCDLIGSLSTSATKKGLYFSYHPELPHCSQMYVNKNALQILIRNVLANAINYTQKGGIQVSLSLATNKLQIEIEDTGKGIADTSMQYFQDHKDKTQHTKSGHGIGLQLARLAANVLDADVEIKRKQTTPGFSSDETNPFSYLKTSQSVTGTIVNIRIAGIWQSDQLSLNDIKANLSQLSDQPELLKQLENLGVTHSTSAACHLSLEKEPGARLALTNKSGTSFKLPYPCSSRKLYALFLKSIAPDRPDAGLGKESVSVGIEKAAVPKGRIALVIDDSAISRQATRQLLENNGWLAREAGDADAGKNALNRMSYDLVIQDASLPDGVMVITDNTPCIAMSASKSLAEELCQTKGRWIGALTKPLGVSDIQAMMTLWKEVAPVSVWEASIDTRIANQHPEEALALAKEALADLLGKWRGLVRAVRDKNLQEVQEVVHYLVGGLHYTGLTALTKSMERLHFKTSEKIIPSEKDMQQLRRTLHQTLALITRL